jgi:hypothetical protein
VKGAFTPPLSERVRFLLSLLSAPEELLLVPTSRLEGYQSNGYRFDSPRAGVDDHRWLRLLSMCEAAVVLAMPDCSFPRKQVLLCAC